MWYTTTGIETTTSGTVKQGPGTIGTKIIAKRYPNTEGLTAGDTIHGK